MIQRTDQSRATHWSGTRRECGQLGLDLGSFFETYDRWKTKILNYFDARQTSAAVEGLNNKARVITKRTYGLKPSEESVGPIDPGLESGVASDRLLDRAHPPDGQGPEGPIRLVLHLKTEEPTPRRPRARRRLLSTKGSKKMRRRGRRGPSAAGPSQ